MRIKIAMSDPASHDQSFEIQLRKAKQKSLRDAFTTLAIRAIILIIAVRVSLALFEVFVAPGLGLKHTHIQAGETAITITIAFIVITAIRRILRRFSGKIPAQFSASISFFTVIIVSLITSLVLLYLWNVQPQEILFGGGVAAIIVGIGLSTIVGNIFSGGLMLTTFPAKIGDSIFIVNDDIRGKVEEINIMYTKISTDHGTEYVVPNSAIMQGNVRIVKEGPLSEQLPFGEGDQIELSNSNTKYSGIVIKTSSRFTTLLDNNIETVIPNSSILDGNFIIKKFRANN